MADMHSKPVIIDVAGVGGVSAAPDAARLHVTTKGRGKKASSAVKASATTARKVLKALDDEHAVAGENGIGQASVHERTRWDGEKEIAEGWEANHSIEVAISAIKKAFDVMTDLASIDGVSIAGPMFSVDRANPAHDEARRLAVADARASAASYASAAGLFLGRLVSISDGSPRHAAPMLERSAMVDGLAPAAQMVTASVHLSFEATGGTP